MAAPGTTYNLNLDLDVCIDAAGNVVITFRDGKSILGATTATLVGDTFSATGVHLLASLQGWLTFSLDVSGTLVNAGTQIDVTVTGTAGSGVYGSADVSASFLIDRDDAVVCALPV